MRSSDKEPNNRQIAKNATLLTFRMVLATIIGLYTSRVVFEQLGDVNYGIYGVVAGCLGFMGFLTASMAGASSRFITYAIGQGKEEEISEIFNSSFRIHCAVAIIVILVGETVGVWLLNNIFNIPTDRMFAAHWVLQFTILSAAIMITQVPYTAVIMAYEKMDVYAWIELLSVFAKLLIVYLISISSFDKLITYSFLLFLVCTVTAAVYRIYCTRTFSVSRIKRLTSREAIRAMIKFSVMDIYGNIGSTMNSQGIVYAINIYFGVVYNAAASLANTVNGILMSLTTNIAVAFRPQIIKQYSIGNLATMKDVMCNSVKFTLIATAILSVPCIFEADYVLKLWLGTIPEYGPEFLRIILILSFFTFINSVCNVAIHATGNIKYLTFINGSVFMILPFTIFYLFHLGLNATTAYLVEIAGTVLIIFNAIAIIHKQIPKYDIHSFIKVIFCCISLIAITSLSVIPIYTYMKMGFMRVALVSIAYATVLSISAYFILLSRENRIFLINKIADLKRRILKL